MVLAKNERVSTCGKSQKWPGFELYLFDVKAKCIHLNFVRW